MADRGDARNPGSTTGPNQYYAQRIDLTRPDMSTVGPGGNQVDRGRINRTMNELDKNQTQANPLGQSHSNGF